MAIAVLALAPGERAAWVLVLFHLVIRFPHVLATGPVALRALAREPGRALELVAVPAALVALYALGASTGPWLPAIAIVLGMHHVAMQHVGICSRYRRRAGRDALPTTGPGALARGGRDRRGVEPGRAVLRREPGLGGLRLGRRGDRSHAPPASSSGSCAGEPAAGPERLAFAVGALTLVPWPFYASLVPGVPAGLTAFLVYNGQHSIAYLGVSARELSLGRKRTAALGLAVLLASLGGTWALGGLDALGGAGTFRLEGALGFFVAHYYLDGRLWKHRPAPAPLR